MLEKKIFPAVQSAEHFELALKSRAPVIFSLIADINDMVQTSALAHNNKKRLFIHLDLATGIGKDKSGIEFIARAGVDGIISTRANLIKLAKEAGLLTIQRFFIVDSHSIDTTVDTLKSSKADMIEVMPGICPKTISILKTKHSIPIIAGGLIETIDEVNSALSAGAYAISTGATKLWVQEEI